MNKLNRNRVCSFQICVFSLFCRDTFFQICCMLSLFFEYPFFCFVVVILIGNLILSLSMLSRITFRGVVLITLFDSYHLVKLLISTSLAHTMHGSRGGTGVWIPRKKNHIIGRHHQPASETQCHCRFAGRTMVACLENWYGLPLPSVKYDD